MIGFDPILPGIVFISLILLAVSIIFRHFRQSSLIAYIIVGVLIGPYGLKIVRNESVISSLGEIGVMLLLFFVGMEISLPKLISNWKVPIIGTFLQIVFSFLFITILVEKLSLPIEVIVLLSFVLTLSSTAIIIRMLQDNQELDSKIGQGVMGILLVQDVAIVPMMIFLTFLKDRTLHMEEIIPQIIGGIVIIVIIAWIVKKGTFKLPFSNTYKKDHELQVFAALAICLGVALLTALAGLSAALGAFVAGIIVSAAKETVWIQDSLHSFRVIFVALFFVSVGMIIDLKFVLSNFNIVLILVLSVFVLNTIINAFIFRFLHNEWNESFYAGALLSQIGEFSFIIISVGLQISIIDQFIYQNIVAVIAITLFLSPFWVSFMKYILKVDIKEKKFIKKLLNKI